MKPLHHLRIACALIAAPFTLAPGLASANEYATTLATLTKEIQQALPGIDESLTKKIHRCHRSRIPGPANRAQSPPRRL